MTPLNQISGKLHKELVYSRRINQLCKLLLEVIPPDTKSLLDVGCGDGLLTSMIKEQRPDLEVKGVDVLVRPENRIEVIPFDGFHLPFDDKSFDMVIFFDVLHHTTDLNQLLKEASRVSRKFIVVKDHIQSDLYSKLVLRFMDWVGNSSHGVALPYNYQTKKQWDIINEKNHLTMDLYFAQLNLYPKPFNYLFDRNLHFLARYRV